MKLFIKERKLVNYHFCQNKGIICLKLKAKNVNQGFYIQLNRPASTKAMDKLL